MPRFTLNQYATSRLLRHPLRYFAATCATALLMSASALWADSARASDIGAVVESVRLGRYPLNAPETRAWGVERSADALLVGRLDNRLFLYHYLRTGNEHKQTLRSVALPMDIPDAALQQDSFLRVVAQQFADDGLYWVSYLLVNNEEKVARGFLVDKTGAASRVLADEHQITVSGQGVWDAARQAQALRVLHSALVRYPSPLKAFPESVKFEEMPAQDVLATFKQLHQKALGMPRIDARFGVALAALQAFFRENDYREIDPANASPDTLDGLNDYGFWLAERGDPKQADAILNEVLRRSPERAAAYLNRADARWRLSGTPNEPAKNYYKAEAREDYRRYCSRRLAANQAVPANIAARMKDALAVKVLDAQTCRPQYEIFVAIAADDAEGVRKQLALGQDPNVQNAYGVSALSFAASRQNIEVVRALLSGGAKADGPAGGTPLVRALSAPKDPLAPAQRYVVADALIAAGASVEAPDSDEASLLMVRAAYYAQDRETLEYLLAKGANPKAQDKKGRSVLHVAMSSPRTRWLAQALLDKGADINAAYKFMYYGNLAMWETPLLDALRESYNDLKPNMVSGVPERVTYFLDHGADPNVGGFGPPEQVARDGMNEALALAVRQLSPALIDLLANAAGSNTVALSSLPLERLLQQWNQVEVYKASSSTPDGAWDDVQLRLRATAERLVANGVSLKTAAPQSGFLRDSYPPLSVPWLPDDLYKAWLLAGADQTQRTSRDTRINGVNEPDVLPLVTMLRLGQTAKVALLLDHDAALYADPQRCGMAVADLLAWQLGNDGPLSPSMARVVNHVLEGARAAASCDFTQTALVSGFQGVSASALAQRAGVALP